MATFTLHLPLPADVIRERIARSLTTTRPGFFSKKDTTFHGEVWADGFRVVRNPARGENSFPIVATGRLVPTAAGTDVIVTTRLPWAGCVFLAIGPVMFTTILLGLRMTPHTEVTFGQGCFILGIGFLLWPVVLIMGVAQEREYERALRRIATTED